MRNYEFQNNFAQMINKTCRKQTHGSRLKFKVTVDTFCVFLMWLLIKCMVMLANNFDVMGFKQKMSQIIIISRLETISPIEKFSELN